MDFESKQRATRLDRIVFLFSQGVAGAVTSSVGALVVFLLLSLQGLFSFSLLAWVLVLGGLGVSRIFFLRKYNNPEKIEHNPEKTLKQYTLLASLAAISWGMLPLLIPHQGEISSILPVLALAIIITVAMPSLSSVASVYYIYLFSVVIPGSMSLLFTSTNLQGIYIGVAYLLVTPLLLTASKRLESSLITSLWSKREVENLIADIQKTNAKLQNVNDALHAKQGIIDEEEEVARHVFDQLTRQSENLLEHCHFWIKPMMSFSGDLVQVTQGPNGEDYILLGDFTGHGLPAALGAVPTSTTFMAMANKGLPVHLIADELNRKLNTLLPVGYFCCAVIMKVDHQKASISFWNGGLPDVLITNKQGTISSTVSSSHLPLGVAEMDYTKADVMTFDATPGSTYYIYSDGATEAENDQGEMLGIEGLKDIIQQPAEDDSGNLANIRQSITDFVGNASPSDDIALVEYRCRHQAQMLNEADMTGTEVATP
ncbi:MAG: PP2C family protein-serine/threonine phosphatase [Gammaproteobacteria bacterium]